MKTHTVSFMGMLLSMSMLISSSAPALNVYAEEVLPETPAVDAGAVDTAAPPQDAASGMAEAPAGDLSSGEPAPIYDQGATPAEGYLADAEHSDPAQGQAPPDSYSDEGDYSYTGEEEYYIPPYNDYYSSAAEDFESALEGLDIEPESEYFDERAMFSSYDYPDEYQIEDFDIIYQEPELPTGCEITAFTMLLSYYLPEAKEDKVLLAKEYLQKSPIATHVGEDGQEYGPDLNQYFVGDPEKEGLVCWPGAIALAGERYIEDHGADLTINILNGIQPDDLYQLISLGVPVMVWVTIGMEERMTPEGWLTEDGEYQTWSSNDHGAVLIGYTEDTVTIADPIDGRVTYKKSTFEKRFYSRKNMCLILEQMYSHEE